MTLNRIIAEYETGIRCLWIVGIKSKWILLLFFTFTGIPVSGQQAVTMEEAIEIAYQQHPRIHSAVFSI